MSLSTNLVSGLVSGFDWRSMIDQLIAIDHRRVELVENKKGEYESKLTEWQSFNAKLLSLKIASEGLDDPDDFNLYTSNMTTNSSTVEASDLISVSTSSSASVGSYSIKVSQIATAQKLSSKSFSSRSDELGSYYSGNILINGNVITISDTDSLSDFMNKINNANSGSDPSGVTANIVNYGTGDYRLTLSSDTTGEEGIGLLNGCATDILYRFGFKDSSRVAKNQIDGGDKSDAFTSTGVNIKTLLELTTTQSSLINEIKINGTGVAAIDLSSDTLTTIKTKLNDVSGVNASIITETVDGVDYHRILIEGASSYTDKNNILETLGIIKGGATDVYGVVGDVSNTSEGEYITSDTLIKDIDGYTGWAANDYIELQGTDTDGNGVGPNTELAIAADKTVSDLLTKIESLFGDVTASVTGDGKIRVVDNTTEASPLAVQIAVKDNGGADDDTLNFDADDNLGTADSVRTRQLVEGLDASILVDGVTVTSSDNTVDDVITGVTLNLIKTDTSEPLTEITLSVNRDIAGIMEKISSFVDSYNTVAAYIHEQQSYDTASETVGGILFGDGTLSSVKSDMTSALLRTVWGVSSSYSTMSMVGINLDNTGQLSIDTDTLQGYLETNYNDIKLLFASNGTTDAGTLEYVDHTRDTEPNEYAVYISQAATQGSATGNTDLSGNLSVSTDKTLAITENGKTATIVLTNSMSLSTIVSEINTDLDTVYTETLVGANQLYEGSGETTKITSNTTWDKVYVGASDANLATGDEITFQGTTRSGASVSGSYEIESVSTDKVQGLLSAIELAYENEIIASVNSSGQIVITDKYTGNSSLSITFDYTQAHALDFGDVSADNTGGQEGRYAIPVTASASADSKYLVLTHDNYGSINSFTISQSGGDADIKEIVYSDTAKTTAASSGQIYVSETTKWDEIYGTTVTASDTITIAGIKHDGSSIGDPVTYNLDVAGEFKAISTLLSDIETAFGGSDKVDARIQDGKIVVEDLQSGDGSLGVNLYYNNEGEDSDLDMGAIDQQTTRDLDLGLINWTNSGLNVAGTIGGESATGSGQSLTGNDGEANVDGLTAKYTGTDEDTNAGNIKLTIGTAEFFERALFYVTDSFEGYAAFKQDSLQNSIDDYDARITEMEASLLRKTEKLVNRFVAMEVALSKIQNQSDWLTGQINASYSGWWG